MSPEDDTRSAAGGGEPASGADLARATLAAAKEQARLRGLAASRRGRRPARTDPASAAEAARADDARDPRPFGTAIRDLVREQGWERTQKVAAIMGTWDRIVGPEVAAHCRPQSLRDGELVVVAESTAWATQLRLLAPALLERLTAELGPGVVTTLRIQGPTGPDWGKGPRRVSGGRGPRDTYG